MSASTATATIHSLLVTGEDDSMAVLRSPTARRRRLSYELRILREQDGRTATDVARDLTTRTGQQWQTSKLTRMERNEWLRPSVRDITDLLDEYNVTDDGRRDWLLSLARRGRERGWWDTAGLSEKYTTYIGLENAARTVRTSRTLILPGLLQTADYARATMRDGPSEMSADEIERRVDVRMKRQEIVHRNDDPMRLWVVMDEAVLRRQVGGREVMRAQMRHLLDVAELAKVTLQVIKFEVGAHPGTSGSFAILEFDEGDLDTVYVEAIPGELFVEEPDQVRQYDVAFQRLTAMASTPSDTLVAIAADV